MRRRTLVAGAVGVALAVSGCSGASTAGSTSAPEPSRTSVISLGTGSVDRTTLQLRYRADGRLTYLDPGSLTGRRAGTVTLAPRQGKSYDRGDVVYAVDLRSVPLLLGTVPLFRTLATGVKGPDVRQLEANLTALGYTKGLNLTVDDRYTATTAIAVRRWQKALRVALTGTVEPADALVAPKPFRVATVGVVVGQVLAGTEKLATTTSTRQGVTASFPSSKVANVRAGSAVRVELPSGDSVSGRVISIGPPTPGTGDDQGGGDGTTKKDDATDKLELQVALRSSVPQRFESVPVSVTVVAEQRKDVLTVPVEALLATSRGFVVVVVSDVRRSVPVRTGMYGDGRVEVTGDVRPGDKVEVPKL